VGSCATVLYLAWLGVIPTVPITQGEDSMSYVEVLQVYSTNKIQNHMWKKSAVFRGSNGWDDLKSKAIFIDQSELYCYYFYKDYLYRTRRQ